MWCLNLFSCTKKILQALIQHGCSQKCTNRVYNRRSVTSLILCSLLHLQQQLFTPNKDRVLIKSYWLVVLFLSPNKIKQMYICIISSLSVQLKLNFGVFENVFSGFQWFLRTFVDQKKTFCCIWFRFWASAESLQRKPTLCTELKMTCYTVCLF